MKKNAIKISFSLVCLVICFSAFAQTAGTMTFTYTPVSHTGYSGTRNVLAVWIQTSAGVFVKTKIRRAGSNTNDHLPTWAVNSGGGANNCLASSCNVVSASTGATLSNFVTQTISWDGTDINGNAVADGTYKVTIESTWNHGGSGSATRSFSFTKGASPVVLSPAADANFTSIGLVWNPTLSGINENSPAKSISIYPNPSKDGFFTIEYDKASNIKVLDILGNTLKHVELTAEKGTYLLDLANYTNGVYFVRIGDGSKSSDYKIVLNK